MTERLSRDEYWEELDPDKLNLTKSDVVDFCERCIDEWKDNKVGNIKYIIAMEIMKAQIKMTPEPVLKLIWKKIILWFYDLTYKNAVANTKDTMLKEIRKLGSRIYRFSRYKYCVSRNEKQSFKKIIWNRKT